MGLPLTGNYIEAVAQVLPSSSLTDFTLLVDLSQTPASQVTHLFNDVNTTDPTRGRVSNLSDTELPFDWIVSGTLGSGNPGFIRIKYTGTLPTSGTVGVKIYAPNTRNTAYGVSDTYGQYNAYDSGIEGFYPVKGDSGTTLTDRTSNTENGTLGSGVSFANDKLFFASGNSGVSLMSSKPLDGATGFTYSAWMNFDDIGEIRYFITDTFGFNEPLVLWLNASGVYNAIVTTDLESSGAINAGVTPTVNTDHYIVFTWDGSTVKLYVDGAEIISGGYPYAINGSTLDASGATNYSLGVPGSNGMEGEIWDFSLKSTPDSSSWISEEYSQTSDNATFWGNWTSGTLSPATVGYDTATITNPSSALTDFTLLIDLSRMSTDWWADVNTSDGTRGRAFKNDGVTELACDWIAFNDTAETGLLRVKWTGTLASSGTQIVRIYAPNTRNTAYGVSDTYGQYNAYDSNWAFYSPNGDGANNRVANQVSGSVTGTVVPDVEDGVLGKATLYNGSDGYWSTIDASLRTTANISMGGIFKTTSTPYTLGDKASQCMLRPYNGVLRYYHDGASTSGPAYTQGIYSFFYLSVDSGGAAIFGVNDGISTTVTSSVGSPLEFALGYHYGASSIYMQHVFRMNTNISEEWRHTEYSQVNDNATFWGTWSWVSGSAYSELDGVVTGLTSIDAILQHLILTSGSVDTTGSLDSTLDHIKPVIASASATGLVDGTLVTVQSLSGEVLGTGTISGNLTIQGKTYVDFTGLSSGASTVDGQLVIVKEMSGEMLGIGEVSGNLVSVLEFSGVTSSTANVTATLQRIVDLSASITATGSSSGQFLTIKALSGETVGTTTVAGFITKIYALSGTAEGTAQITGLLEGASIYTSVFEGNSFVTLELDSNSAITLVSLLDSKIGS